MARGTSARVLTAGSRGSRSGDAFWLDCQVLDVQVGSLVYVFTWFLYHFIAPWSS